MPEHGPRLLPHSLLKWSALWLATWGVTLLLWGYDPLIPARRPGIILGIFAVAIFLSSYLILKKKGWASRMRPLELVVMLLGILVFCLLYPSTFPDSLLIAAHIVFQQIMISLLVFMVPSHKFASALWRVLIFFGLSHMLLALFLPLPYALLMTAFALAVAPLFVLLMQRVPYGLAASLLIHLAFYLMFFRIV